jgi:hypothetical protein
MLSRGTKMNKFTGVFLAAALAAVGFALLLTTCEMGLDDDIPQPPGVPVGKVMNNGKEVLVEADYTGGDCQFVLEWKSVYEGVLSSDADYSYLYTKPEAEAEDQKYTPELKALYLKWKEYQEYMDSRPFYPPVSTKNLNVWDPNLNKLLNRESDARFGIQRYWPRDLQAKGQPLTVAAWYGDPDNNVPSSNARRKADFLAVKAQMEAQIAALKASPFYDVWYLHGSEFHYYPLRMMCQDMENFISTGNIPAANLYTDSEWAAYFDANRNPIYNNVGDLYTIFFGPIPRKTDYVVSTDTYPDSKNDTFFVFPEE